MQAKMEVVTKDAEIGPDGNLYLLTFTESVMKRLERKDLKNLSAMGIKIDIIDTKTHKLIRSFDIDVNTECFGN